MPHWHHIQPISQTNKSSDRCRPISQSRTEIDTSWDRSLLDAAEVPRLMRNLRLVRRASIDGRSASQSYGRTDGRSVLTSPSPSIKLHHSAHGARTWLERETEVRVRVDRRAMYQLTGLMGQYAVRTGRCVIGLHQALLNETNGYKSICSRRRFTYRD